MQSKKDFELNTKARFASLKSISYDSFSINSVSNERDSRETSRETSVQNDRFNSASNLSFGSTNSQPTTTTTINCNKNTNTKFQQIPITYRTQNKSETKSNAIKAAYNSPNRPVSLASPVDRYSSDTLSKHKRNSSRN